MNALGSVLKSANPASLSTASPVKIRATGVKKVYSIRNKRFTAISDISLEINEGEFLALVGPSGCGKSTFLRIVAGLIRPSEGSVTIRRSAANDKRPLTSIVFQEYAIFPWKTVRQNVGFGLKMRDIPHKEREDIVDLWLSRVGLSAFADAYPRQLSGGMKQRVSIARAFASDPEVLLMDEPLGALDAQTRLILQGELLRLWEEQKKTVLYVTHSLEEAALLSDRVVLMTASPGAIKTSFENRLSRPRTVELMGDPEFSALTTAIWKALKQEVVLAMEHSNE